MTDHELSSKIESLWNAMYSTAGQDQWPCDVLWSLRSEILFRENSYQTRTLNKFLPDLLALVVGEDRRIAAEEIVKAVIVRRASLRRGARASS